MVELTRPGSRCARPDDYPPYLPYPLPDVVKHAALGRFSNSSLAIALCGLTPFVRIQKKRLQQGVDTLPQIKGAASWDAAYMSVTDSAMQALTTSGIGWETAIAGASGALSDDRNRQVAGNDSKVKGFFKLKSRHDVEGGREFFLQYAIVDALRKGELPKLVERILTDDNLPFLPTQRIALTRLISSQEAMMRVCGRFLSDNPLVQNAVAQLRRSNPDSLYVALFDEAESTKYAQSDRDVDTAVQADLQLMQIPELVCRFAFMQHNGNPLFNAIANQDYDSITKALRARETKIYPCPVNPLVDITTILGEAERIFPEYIDNLGQHILAEIQGQVKGDRSMTDKSRRSADFALMAFYRMLSQGLISRYSEDMQRFKELVMSSSGVHQKPPSSLLHMIKGLHTSELQYGLPVEKRVAETLRYMYLDNCISGLHLNGQQNFTVLVEVMGHVREDLSDIIKRGKPSDQERERISELVDRLSEAASDLPPGYLSAKGAPQIQREMQAIVGTMFSTRGTDALTPDNRMLMRAVNIVDLAHHLIPLLDNVLTNDIRTYNIASQEVRCTRKQMLEWLANDWKTLAQTPQRDITGRYMNA